jgi:hypothetical protein
MIRRVQQGRTDLVGGQGQGSGAVGTAAILPLLTTAPAVSAAARLVCTSRELVGDDEPVVLADVDDFVDLRERDVHAAVQLVPPSARIDEAAL